MKWINAVLQSERIEYMFLMTASSASLDLRIHPASSVGIPCRKGRTEPGWSFNVFKTCKILPSTLKRKNAGRTCSRTIECQELDGDLLGLSVEEAAVYQVSEPLLGPPGTQIDVEEDVVTLTLQQKKSHCVDVSP
jgi:hypothetical protein